MAPGVNREYPRGMRGREVDESQASGAAVRPAATPTGRLRAAPWRRVAAVVISALAALAWAQDGSAAAQEELQAAIAAFETADAVLNDVYAQAAQLMPPTEFGRLRLEQREWVAARDVEAETYAQVFAGPEADDVRETSYFYEYAAGLTEERTQLLRALVAYYIDSTTQTWQGLWVDGHGGHLAVMELEDGRLRFQLTVVRSPALHTGWIEGFAERVGDLARHDTAYDTVDGEVPVWVFFVRDGPYLLVRTANAEYFAGARAYFDGRYARLRDLEPFDID